MRVALFSDTYRPRIGGVTLSVLLTAETLRRSGAEAVLFVPSPPGSMPERDVVYFPTTTVHLGGSRVRTAVPCSASVARAFADARIDVVHSFSPFLVGAAARRLARKHRVPTVFTYQTQYAEYLHFLPLGKYLAASRPVKRLASQAVATWTRATCNAFDAIVVPTERAACSLRHASVIRQVEILPVGFDLRFPNVSENAVRKRAGVSSEALLFLHVGRLSREKNIPFLIRAFALACERSARHIHLLIAGDGPERFPLEYLVRSLKVSHRVSFVGNIEHEGIGPFYQAADAFLFSSLTDVQAFVVCEALIAGLPVVALRAPGPMDYVVDGREGLLVDKDQEEFTGAMLKITQSDTLRRLLSDGARKAGSGFSLSRYGESLVSLYAGLRAGSYSSANVRRESLGD